MDILEFIKPESTFTPSEVIQEKITFLISELYQYKLLRASPGAEEEIIESWRNDLWAIRSAISNVLDGQK